MPFYRNLMREVKLMKEGIHPKYEQTTIRCACGAVIETGSTKRTSRLKFAPKCHPFYTGKQKLVDTGGRVDRFNRKYGLVRSKSAPAYWCGLFFISAKPVAEGNTEEVWNKPDRRRAKKRSLQDWTPPALQKEETASEVSLEVQALLETAGGECGQGSAVASHAGPAQPLWGKARQRKSVIWSRKPVRSL